MIEISQIRAHLPSTTNTHYLSKKYKYKYNINKFIIILYVQIITQTLIQNKIRTTTETTIIIRIHHGADTDTNHSKRVESLIDHIHIRNSLKRNTSIKAKILHPRTTSVLDIIEHLSQVKKYIYIYRHINTHRLFIKVSC